MFEEMNPMDKPTAVAEILIMVAGAALIGFLAAWIMRKLQVDRMKADLRFMESKHDSLAAKSDSDTKNSNELQRLVDDLRARKDALFSELEQLKKKHLNDSDGKIDLDELEALRAQSAAFEAERKDMEDEIAALKEQPDLERLNSRIASLEAENNELRAKPQIADDNEAIAKLKSEMSQTAEERDQLQRKLDMVTDSLPDPGDLDRLQARIDQMETENSSLKDRIGKMDDQSEADRIRRLNQEIQSIRSVNKQLEDEVHELEERLAEETKSAPVDPKELSDLKLEVSALQSERDSLEEALKKQIDDQAVRLAAARAEAEEQDSEEETDDVVEEAEEEAQDAQTEEPAETVQDEENADEDDEQEASLTYEEFQAKKKALLDSVGKAWESDKDNLTRIEGIGPFIEAKLNKVGIFTYGQIAAMTPGDIRHVTRLIEFFKGRIESDDWIGQARKLTTSKEEV